MLTHFSWHCRLVAGTCKSEQVESLPVNDTIPGVLIYPSTVTAVTVSNYTSQDSGPFDFCDVNFAYSQAGGDDTVNVNYWLPSSGNFQDHHVSAVAESWGITTQNSSLPQALEYGTVSGTTEWRRRAGRRTCWGTGYPLVIANCQPSVVLLRRVSTELLFQLL